MPLTPDEIRPRLRGVIAFPITPFDDDLKLKERAFQSHVDYLVRSGLHSIVAAGGTGELYSMTTDEIRRVYRLAVEAVGGRVPVIAGVGYNLAIATDVALGLFRAASEGNYADVNRLLATRIRPVYNVRSRRRGYEVTTTKEAMNLLGRDGGRVRPPLAELTADDRRALRDALSAMGYSVAG